MKAKVLLSILRVIMSAVCLLVVGVALPAAPALAQSNASVDVFFNDLEPDGRWVDHHKYGRVWYPNNVEADWRPYTQSLGLHARLWLVLAIERAVWLGDLSLWPLGLRRGLWLDMGSG